MKVAIITDQHFGSHKGSQVYLDYYSEFYENIFFPWLKRNKITTLLDLGDTFDNRKSIDFVTLNWARKYYDTLRAMDITVHTLVGNHTAYYKNTNELNTLALLLQDYDNVYCYDDAIDLDIGGTSILFVPWICAENYDKSLKTIRNSTSKVAMGHLELSGYLARPGFVYEHGMDAGIFSHFDLVLSGHFHHKSSKGNIKYLGNPYQIYWNDYGDPRGFHSFDTETFKLKFIKNPYEIFSKVYWNDDTEIESKNYKGQYVKVIVEQKTNYARFEHMINSLYDEGALDVSVIEKVGVFEDPEANDVDVKDTLTLLDEYLDDVEVNVDKTALKSLMKSLYIESCEAV
tara:strand:+ start:3794 stop:4825 length:1032 start_codon:yes stop_codon:yes gene_type:complete